MTAEELAALKTRVSALETAYDELVTGARLAEARYENFSEKFHAADAGRLENLIARLKHQIARAEGGSGGAIHIGF